MKKIDKKIIIIMLMILIISLQYFKLNFFKTKSFKADLELPPWIPDDWMPDDWMPELPFEDIINFELNETIKQALFHSGKLNIFITSLNNSKIFLSLNTSQTNYSFDHFFSITVASSEILFLNITFLENFPSFINPPNRSLDMILEIIVGNSSDFSLELGLKIDKSKYEAQNHHSLDINSLQWAYCENAQWKGIPTTYDADNQFIFAKTTHASYWTIIYDFIYIYPVFISVLICLIFLPIICAIILIKNKRNNKKNLR